MTSYVEGETYSVTGDDGVRRSGVYTGREQDASALLDVFRTSDRIPAQRGLVHVFLPVPTVTVTHARKRWSLAFSKLPDQTFGPYGFAEVIGQLRVAALLSALDARNLVMDAATAEDHTATASTG